MKTKTKSYELHLPVYKKGDDMAHCLEVAKDNFAEALVMQAKNYEGAAQMCRRLASVAAEGGVSSMFADTHVINLQGDVERLDSLVREGVLAVDEFHDDEDDEYEETQNSES